MWTNALSIHAVTPAKAGVPLWRPQASWIPAFAGMTDIEKRAQEVN
jgi:hypothetical protein